MTKLSDKQYIVQLIQDMRIKIRDIENYFEKQAWIKRLKLFEEGIKEEYGNS